MTWSDPTTRSTGDLITAAIWNQEVVDNAQFLHDRVLQLWIPYDNNNSLGDYGASYLGPVRFSVYIPDDFESLSAAYVAVSTNVTTTLNYDITSDYGQPGGSENYNNHSESLTGQSLSMSISKMYLIDVSAVLSSLTPGDLLGLTLSKNSGTNFQYAFGMLMLINLS